MGKLVQPRTYLIGFTVMNEPAVIQYLQDTEQTDFLADMAKAKEQGVSSAEILCSFAAKACYKSLTAAKNANIEKTRSVKANLEGCHDTGHGSVFEHCQINFMTTNLSRIATHEQVRHRVGTAFSQTSGRFCRLDSIDLVWDPVLDPVKALYLSTLETIEKTIYMSECVLGLRKPPPDDPNRPSHSGMWIPDMTFPMDKRKEITSALRRIAPNGQANEMVWSVNIRGLRHFVMVRTSPYAEREIRIIAGQAYELIREKFPTVFYGAKEKIVKGLKAVYGMKTQPYEKSTDYLDE